MAPFWNQSLSLASIHGYFPLHQRQISGIIMTSVSPVLCPHLFFDCQLSSAVHPRIPGGSVLCGGVFLSFGCCGGGSGGGWEIWTRMAQMPQTILGGGALEMTIFLQELRLGELNDDILRGSTLTQTRWYLVLQCGHLYLYQVSPAKPAPEIEGCYATGKIPKSLVIKWSKKTKY